MCKVCSQIQILVWYSHKQLGCHDILILTLIPKSKLLKYGLVSKLYTSNCTSKFLEHILRNSSKLIRLNS